MTDNLLMDLITRCEESTRVVCHLSVDTGVTFDVSDIVDHVERNLPADYPVPTSGPNPGPAGRRAFIDRIVVDLVSGILYDEG